MSRGFTLLELLVAMVAGAIALFGAMELYAYALRYANQSQSQSFLQSQGPIIMEEMKRQIINASALTRGACNADPNSIGATNSSGTFCFYSAGNPLQLWENRGGGTPENLLSGSAVRLTLVSLTTSIDASSSRVTITFTLRDNVPNSMTFTTDLTKRN